MAKRFVVLVLLLLAGPGPAAAQEEDRLEILLDDLENGVGDIVHIWTAPFRVGFEDVPALLAVAEVTLLSGGYDAQVQGWVRRNPRALPVRVLDPVREGEPLSRVGYTWTLLALSGAFYATGLAFEVEDLRTAGIGCATSDLANTFARHALARLIGRLRPESRKGPYVIDFLAFGDWEMRSFPGGHAANIMACTTFWAHRFELGIAEPLLYLFAAGVGAARIPDEAHWLSDTVIGMIFGAAVGWGVAERFLERAADEARGGDDRRTGRAPRLYLGWRIPFR